MVNDEVIQKKITGRRLSTVFTEIKTIKKDLGNKFIREQRTLVNEYIRLAQSAFDREDWGKARLWSDEALDIAKTNPNGRAWMSRKNDRNTVTK